MRKPGTVWDYNGWCLRNHCPPFTDFGDGWTPAGGGCTPFYVCTNQGTWQPFPITINFRTGLPYPGVVVGHNQMGYVKPHAWLGNPTNTTKVPGYRTQKGVVIRPLVPPFVDPWFQPINAPAVQPRQGPVPGLPDTRSPPTPEVSTGSYGDVRPVTVKTPRPPEGGVKERKGAVSKGVAALMRIAFEATEVIDAIDAIYAALPKKLQKRGLTPQQKALAIYRYSDQIDLNQVALNVLANHFTDEIIGRASVRSDQFLKNAGVTVYGGGQAF